MQEREGFKVNREHLRNAQTKAEADQMAANLYFRKWASLYCEDAQHMNLSSGAQIRQLLFAGVANSIPGKEGCARGLRLGRPRCGRLPNVFSAPSDRTTKREEQSVPARHAPDQARLAACTSRAWWPRQPLGSLRTRPATLPSRLRESVAGKRKVLAGPGWALSPCVH